MKGKLKVDVASLIFLEKFDSEREWGVCVLKVCLYSNKILLYKIIIIINEERKRKRDRERVGRHDENC